MAADGLSVGFLLPRDRKKPSHTVFLRLTKTVWDRASTYSPHRFPQRLRVAFETW